MSTALGQLSFLAEGMKLERISHSSSVRSAYKASLPSFYLRNSTPQKTQLRQELNRLDTFRIGSEPLGWRTDDLAIFEHLAVNRHWQSLRGRRFVPFSMIFTTARYLP